MLFGGNHKEPLYFVKVTEKGTAQKGLTNPMATSLVMKVFERILFETVKIKAHSKKRFQVLLTPIVFAPDEVFDTYVEITKYLYLDAQHFKLLIQKVNSYM